VTLVIVLVNFLYAACDGVRKVCMIMRIWHRNYRINLKKKLSEEFLEAEIAEDEAHQA
jgi:hypothetical protein